MISPLGPRGAIGVSNTLRAPDLQNLNILVDYAKMYGPARLRSTSGTTQVIQCARFHGRKTENKRRAAARRAAK